MKKIAEARIRWLSPEEGGRKHPPTGPRYSTVVHFEKDTTDWPNTAWSLVVDFHKPGDAALDTTATVWLLFHDRPGAPHHFFQPSNRFELLEGDQVVAKGQILSVQTE